MSELSIDDLARLIWFRGEVEPWTRRHRQRQIYRILRQWERRPSPHPGPMVLNCHRRLGKSFVLILYLWSRCLRRPGQIAKLIAPSVKQGRDFLEDIIRHIMAISPEETWPERSGDNWTFRNPNWPDGAMPSILQMRGVYDGGDSGRGPRANVIAVDECREIDNLRYLVENVLIQQFVAQESPLLILSSSVPKSAAHEFVSHYMSHAQQRKLYIECPGEANGRHKGNPDFTEEDKRIVLHDCLSEEDPAYQREVLCLVISDPESMVVREFPSARGRVVVDTPRPAVFDAYVGADFGWQDHNGVLFADFDFLRQKLCFRDEIFLNNITTGALAESCRAKEHDLWSLPGGRRAPFIDHHGNGWRYRSITRVGDHTLQQLQDLAQEHDYPIAPAEKWDRDAALSEFRHDLVAGRIEISPNCQHLIQQCEHGIWKQTRDGARRDFARDKILGHLDCLMAAVYLRRAVDWQSNPQRPEVPGIEQAPSHPLREPVMSSDAVRWQSVDNDLSEINWGSPRKLKRPRPCMHR